MANVEYRDIEEAISRARVRRFITIFIIFLVLLLIGLIWWDKNGGKVLRKIFPFLPEEKERVVLRGRDTKSSQVRY